MTNEQQYIFDKIKSNKLLNDIEKETGIELWKHCIKSHEKYEESKKLKDEEEPEKYNEILENFVKCNLQFTCWNFSIKKK